MNKHTKEAQNAQEFIDRCHYEVIVKKGHYWFRKQAVFAKNWTYIPEVKETLE